MKKPGRKTTVKVGSQILSANVYSEDRSGLLKEVQYGNGGRVKYAYDGFDRLTGVSYDGVSAPRYTYEYDASGRTSVAKDRALNCVFQTECDLSNRPMSTQLRNEDGSLIYRTMLNYDKQNRLIGFGEEADGSGTFKTSYVYDNDNRVTEIGFGGSDKIKYTYDNLGRVTSRTAENGTDAGKLTSTYTYVAGRHGTGSTTPLVKKIDQAHIPFEYEYDSRGNIISEKRGSLTTTYAYDSLGQLIRVNDPHENATWVYNYDRGGNITSKVKYAYTTSILGKVQQTIPYSYGDSNWKDKLTAYNGKTITYDAIGNPLNDGTWTYTWQAGRQLKQMTKSGTAVQFKYDQNGLRVSKIVNGTQTKYVLHGKLVAHMSCGSDNLHFFYDAAGHPMKVSFNGVMYTYVHNVQGDIVGILDSAGVLVVEYKYDAWGKPISTTGTLATTLGKKNPFRYRGYVYDEETELYDLRMRYYSPCQCRFISADSQMENKSLYSYCSNIPVMYGDWNGTRESGSDSSGDITDFTREGFELTFITFSEYNPILGANIEHHMAILYIPYQDIQYYNNFLLFESCDPKDVLIGSIGDESISYVIDKGVNVFDRIIGLGTALNAIITVLGIVKGFFEAKNQKEVLESHKAAQQLATDRKTGMYVVIDKVVTKTRFYDVCWPGNTRYLTYCERDGIKGLLKPIFMR